MKDQNIEDYRFSNFSKLAQALSELGKDFSSFINKAVERSNKSFVAIDFETAVGFQRSTACAVGAVLFENGVPIKRVKQLIRPPDNYYLPSNIEYHGISPDDTINSPDFPEAWESIAGMLEDRLVVVHNTSFDISVLHRSAEHYDYMPAPFSYADTLSLARMILPDEGTYKLDYLAELFGIPLTHHDPTSDAEAAGLLYLTLSKEADATSNDLDDIGKALGYYHPINYQIFSDIKPSNKGNWPSFDFEVVQPSKQSAVYDESKPPPPPPAVQSSGNKEKQPFSTRLKTFFTRLGNSKLMIPVGILAFPYVAMFYLLNFLYNPLL